LEQLKNDDLDDPAAINEQSILEVLLLPAPSSYFPLILPPNLTIQTERRCAI